MPVPDRRLFQAWMADRLQLQVPGLERGRAAACALAILDARLAAVGAPFGHPDHGWAEPDAWTLVDLDLEACPFDPDAAIAPTVELEAA